MKALKNIQGDSFGLENKYKLYRTVYEIIHPTISKKNISSYKIVLKDDLVPLRIFYPDKVSSLKSVIIFIHGDDSITNCDHSYAKICRDIAKRCNRLVIALDYKNPLEYKFPISLDECYETIGFLYKELVKLDIREEDIVLMGDSFGANLLASISLKNREDKKFKINKEVLLYPVLSNEYVGKDTSKTLAPVDHITSLTIKKVNNFFDFYVGDKNCIEDFLVCPLKNNNYKNLPTTLIVTGGLDPLKKQGLEYYKRLKQENDRSEILDISFASHGFLNSSDEEILDEFYTKVKLV